MPQIKSRFALNSAAQPRPRALAFMVVFVLFCVSGVLAWNVSARTTTSCFNRYDLAENTFCTTGTQQSSQIEQDRTTATITSSNLFNEQDYTPPRETNKAQSQNVVVRVNRKKPAGKSNLAVGTTHMQYSLDAWGNAKAVDKGKDLLQEASVYQNQHIMGFGTINPEPSPGDYDWKSLDARVQLMRETKAIPTITLCCAPDWMKGGKPGTTDWSQLEVAPRAEHYDDFAELARQVALRYPDVKHYIVWNEFKGFWKPSINNWDYVAYTTFYNKIYDALKSVDPSIQVGGPYLVIEGTGSNHGHWSAEMPITKRNRIVLDYWLKHKHGADFIAVDRSVKTYHDRANYTDAQYLALTPLYTQVTRQLKQMTDLPIWWAESYFTGRPSNRTFEAAGLASMLYHQLTAGASVSMRWSPQAQPNELVGQNLFTDTLVEGGGQPLPAYYVYKAFREHFGPGTQLYQSSSSSPDIEVLASATKTLLINKRSTAVRVRLNDQLINLQGYEVRIQ
jgi:hypothetical protein